MEMATQHEIDFSRISKAIAYLREHYREQPGLDAVAAHVHMSPYHFQRMFTEWAGVSPKKFLQYLSAEHAKRLLKSDGLNLEQTADALGLSGSSRLHDLFVKIEGMTPAEYRDGGRNLEIRYDFRDTPFGEVLIASTLKGICHMGFSQDREGALEALRQQFPAAVLLRELDPLQEQALVIFSDDWRRLETVKLHLKGTDFQLKVWESLLKIPAGGLASYGQLAGHMGSPGASRAVGSAVGDNPVAYLIPCHRVIRAGGALGGYRWGTDRKAAILGWEAGRAAS